MSEPMTPEQAQEVLRGARENHTDLGPDARHALETIAHMDMEEENVATYDGHGALHITHKWIRLVGEWSKID